MDSSLNVRMLSDKIYCWRVDAADAKKAEGASIWALRMPKPPSPTGCEACVHWSSFRSTFKILVSPARNVLSNWLSSGLSAHSEVLSRYNSLGIARLFMSIASASWACRWASRSIAVLRSSTYHYFFWPTVVVGPRSSLLLLLLLFFLTLGRYVPEGV